MCVSIALRISCLAAMLTASAAYAQPSINVMEFPTFSWETFPFHPAVDRATITSASRDGTLMYGYFGHDASSPEWSFRWTQSTGYELLSHDDGTRLGTRLDASSDGHTVVGTDSHGLFRIHNGLHENIGLPSGYELGDAPFVSGDGGTLAFTVAYPVGQGTEFRAASWSSANGLILNEPTYGTPYERASAFRLVSGVTRALSHDGQRSLGWSGDFQVTGEGMPSIWAADGQPVVGFQLNSDAVAISSSGTLAILDTWTPDGMSRELSMWIDSVGLIPMPESVQGHSLHFWSGDLTVGAGPMGYWTVERGFVDLQAELLAYGLIPTTWTHFEILGITEDGSTLWGNSIEMVNGTTPYNRTWTVTIPSPSVVVILGVAGVYTTRRRR